MVKSSLLLVRRIRAGSLSQTRVLPDGTNASLVLRVADRQVALTERCVRDTVTYTQDASHMKAFPVAVLAGVLGVGMLVAISDTQLLK